MSSPPPSQPADLRASLNPLLPILAAVGCAIGATASHYLWPQLAFARNLTGQYHPEMIPFAGLVGLCLALGQIIALARRRAVSAGRLVLWLPITVAGVIGLILPLWWMDAEVLVLAPWVAILMIAPGLLVIATLQAWLVGPRLGRMRWFAGTMLGGMAGVVAGLFVAAGVALLLPFEAGWAAGVGLGMGIGQTLRGRAKEFPSPAGRG